MGGKDGLDCLNIFDSFDGSCNLLKSNDATELVDSYILTFKLFPAVSFLLITKKD
jgi:hypothetical protein